MNEKQFYVYIMTNKHHGTLYVGVTSDLPKRVWQHRNHDAKGFTDRYNLEKLVYYEAHGTAEFAIRREKRLKLWLRSWKLELIDQFNPQWEDLYDAIAA